MLINLTPHALLFTIAAIGISEASYLIRKRIAAEQPVCPIGEGCHPVLTSVYNRIFGIHNDILGFAFYIAFAFIAAIIVIGIPQIGLVIQAAWLMLVGATAMSAFLTYVQWHIVKAWCFWCLMSAGTVVLMDIIFLTMRLI